MVMNERTRRWYVNFTGIGGDGRVPCTAVIDGQAWANYFSAYHDRLVSVRDECPDVSFVIPDPAYKGRTGREEVTDRWGCRWLYNENSGDGQVIGHPLWDWDAYEGFSVPDVDSYMDWDALKRQTSSARANGGVASVGFEHGFFFLRLAYLRGFENLMLDIAEGEPRFHHLLARLTEFWVGVGERAASLNPDLVNLADDLGMQHSLPVSPQSWRKYIKPAYSRIISAFKSTGARVALHTDGRVVDIIPDLIECGVDVLNPQDLVNGLDNLARLAKGKIAINLDIDRQTVTPFGTPEDIAKHVGECVKILGSPTGGLSLIYGAYLGVPVENLEAVVRAMQEYHDYWVSK